MVKVALTNEQKISLQEEKLKAWCWAQLKQNRIQQKEIAELIGVTPAAVSNNLCHGNVSTRLLIGIISKCKDLDAEELKEVLSI